ncbi:MAG TPA: hypothetical protein VKJ47_03150 [Candidatus Binatia bacterium]|nr:hypothetical protein [Candidatus Binatia bacterium]
MSQQSSQKSGKQSTAKKLAFARHGFAPTPATRPVAGAAGKSGKPVEPRERTAPADVTRRAPFTKTSRAGEGEENPVRRGTRRNTNLS